MKNKTLILFTAILFSLQGHCQNDYWKFQTGGRIYASPVVSDNVIYIGSSDSTFYAIDKTSGSLIWSFPVKGGIHSSACVDGDKVIFLSADGTLHALQTSNGKQIWQFETQGEQMQDVWDYYLSAPLAYQGLVYFGSSDGYLYALEGNSGRLSWKFKANGMIHAAPIASEDRLYFGDYGGWFYSLGAATGQLIWQFQTVGDTYFPRGEIQKAASLDKGIIYFGSRDYNIYALDAATGRGHWNMKEIGSWIIATPMVKNGSVYFGTSDTHRFYCLNSRNGTMKWKAELPMRVYGAAVERDGVVYFGCFDGILRGLDAETGELRWKFQTEGSRQYYPQVYDENGQFNKSFELYGADYLESERKIHLLGSILSTPLIDGNRLYFGSSDGGLYSVSL